MAEALNRLAGASGWVGQLRRSIERGLLLLMLAVAGCDSGEMDRVVVSGAVTYNGRPIELGQIRLVPDQNTIAPTSGAAIIDGHYAINTKGGVPVGSHRVEIFGYEKGASPGEQGRDLRSNAGEIVGRQYLPARFNSKSELVLNVRSEDGAVTRDFALAEASK